jgi:hypothetical protein
MQRFLNRFLKNVEATLRRPARRRASPPPARLAIETLEDRFVPAGVGLLPLPSLLHNVEVSAVYYGPGWNTPAQQQRMQQLDAYLDHITDSSYMDMLGEYGIGRGRFSGRLTTSDRWATAPTLIGGSYQPVLDDSSIHTMLRDQIRTHALPPIDANRLYVVFLPPRVYSRGPGGNSWTIGKGGYVAYHNVNFDLIKGNVYYAVIPDQSGVAGIPEGASPYLTPLQFQTLTTSHELAEAVTDPDTVTGWRDRNPFDGSLSGDEIGDLAQDLHPGDGQATGWLDGYLVQKEWSNQANGIVLWQSQPGWDYLNGHALRQLAVGRDKDGREEVFALGGDGEVFYKVQDAPNSATYSRWESLGGDVRAIRAHRDAFGRLWVFALGLDGAARMIHQTTANADTWSGWSGLGGAGIKQLEVGSDADGRLEAFVVGSDNAVWHAWQTSVTGGWIGWARLGGTVRSIQVANDHSGAIQVFALGVDGSAYQIGEKGPNGYWGQWSWLGGSGIQQLEVGSDADGRLEVFVVGGDNAVWHDWQLTAGGWSGWASLGGYVQSFQVGRDNAGDLQVIAVGFDRHVYDIGQNAPNGNWGGWTGLGGDLVSVVTGNDYDGTLRIYGLSANGGLYTRSWWNTIIV